MKTNSNPALITSIIRDSGIIAADKPSVNYPIPVNLFYCNNADGSVRWIWPKGSRRRDFSTLFYKESPKVKLMANLHRLFFALGLDSALSHGRLVIYTDVPTATYLQKQWRMN